MNFDSTHAGYRRRFNKNLSRFVLFSLVAVLYMYMVSYSSDPNGLSPCGSVGIYCLGENVHCYPLSQLHVLLIYIAADKPKLHG